MIEKVLNAVKSGANLITAIQVGVDSEFSLSICEKFLLCHFVDIQETATKTAPEKVVKCSTIYSSESKCIEEFEYLGLTYDFAYIHDKNSKMFQREIFNYLTRTGTKVILTDPNVFELNPRYYKKMVLRKGESQYRIYYLDIIGTALEKKFPMSV